MTGSAGNVTAGKYNDGSPPMRAVLTDRVHAGMVAADQDAKSHVHSLDEARWLTSAFSFAPRADLDVDKLKAIVADPKQSLLNRNRGAMTCGWLARVASQRPIVLSRLDLGDGGTTLLHLPAETFVEYQLDAQRALPGKFLATAAYGDGGPWYIPLQRSFAEGGYEPSAALVREDSETSYRRAIEALLKAKPPGDGA